ncbi:MAG: hypothetical protein HFF47_02115 [Lawsonibacter sp.]|jgi:hypothetical protein|nr:hypothetical protein [Lawsonibacter sp.]
MDEHKKIPAPKRLKKPNVVLRLLTLLVTAFLILGAMVLVIYRDTVNVDTLKRWLTYQSMEPGQAAPFPHAGGDKLSVAYLDSGVVTASAAGAHYYGLDGEPLAEAVLSMENPVLSASNTTAVVYDAGNQSLFAFRNGRQSFSLSLSGGADLLSARPNNSGWLAVTAQQSGYKGAVTVYDSRGIEVIQISLSSTFAVDAAVSPDGRTVAVVTIGQQGGAFFSRLLLYHVNQEEPFAQLELGSLSVLDMDFDEDLIWLVGEDRLLTVSLSSEGETLQTYYISPNYLKGCSLGGDGFALVLTGRYRSGNADQAIIVDSTARAVQVLPLSNQILDYAAAGSYCALLTGTRLNIYDSTLTPYSSLDNVLAARRLDLAPNGSALLANGQQAWLYIP